MWHILNDVETRQFGYGQYKMINAWVKDGGTLLILGGLFTLGQGYNMRYGWPDLLPVELNMQYEFRKCDPPVKFGRANALLGVSPSVTSPPPTRSSSRGYRRY